MDNQSSELIISVKNEIFIYDDNESIAKVAAGNKLKFTKDLEKLRLIIGNKEFVSFEFSLLPYDETEIIKIDEKKYRGRIVISNVDSEIKLVNQIGIEDYVKGVMTKEMPVGKGHGKFSGIKSIFNLYTHLCF